MDLASGGVILRAQTTRAYLAPSPAFAFLVFRGTDCLADWGVDLSAERAQMPGAPAGVHVRSGFLRAFRADQAAIHQAVATYVAPGVGLYVTGHSSGGALAQLAAAALDGYSLAACYTFGSPRVATLAFDRLVKAPHYRVVNGWDLVPGVPEPWIRGHRHTGDPRLLTGDGQEAYRRDRSPLARRPYRPGRRHAVPSAAAGRRPHDLELPRPAGGDRRRALKGQKKTAR